MWAVAYMELRVTINLPKRTTDAGVREGKKENPGDMECFYDWCRKQSLKNRRDKKEKRQQGISIYTSFSWCRWRSKTQSWSKLLNKHLLSYSFSNIYLFNGYLSEKGLALSLVNLNLKFSITTRLSLSTCTCWLETKNPSYRISS